MAILSNGKFYGFLCSVKETGQKLANGVKEYVEDFMSGFAGHGWKLWEYMTGKWKLEIDTIVVRETMIVFEMLISKIRAIIGAQTISQGHGKVKSARISDDGTEYLIVLEDEDMSIVAHDFVRCQTFVGDKTKLYHVEVDSVDVETKTLHIPLSEFDFDEAGNVIYPPAAGDELIQFGNSQNKARQSAIYLHADETGQPAIDVMFDINSKNWDGKVKIRVGGDIPGSNGLKGFYSMNGMIKGVDNDENITYCIYPDGSAEFGCGAALFKPDKSGHIAGGAISWALVEGKYVCTMRDVVLTWDNLSDEAKENLKGEPGTNGKDGEPGKDGQDGKDGYNGIDGADGVNGKDGISLMYKGEYSSHPDNPKNGWYYRNTTDKKCYVYQDNAWYVMTVDGSDGKNGLDGINGKDGNDGLDIVWKGDSSIPPDNPQKNWAYRDTDNGRVYIYNGTAWALMVADGNDGVDGTDGTDGKDGMRGYITYNDSEKEPAKPTGDGTMEGWHTDSTASVIWISQKVAESADSGEWGNPIRLKGETGKDANLLPWIEKWNGYATELGEEYIVTPKMFSGTKTVNSEGTTLLTGILQGKDCLTSADGTKHSGVFALVDNEIVFSLDPINKECKFEGRVISNAGNIGGWHIDENSIYSESVKISGEYFSGSNITRMNRNGTIESLLFKFGLGEGFVRNAFNGSELIKWGKSFITFNAICKNSFVETSGVQMNTEGDIDYRFVENMDWYGSSNIIVQHITTIDKVNDRVSYFALPNTLDIAGATFTILVDAKYSSSSSSSWYCNAIKLVYGNNGAKIGLGSNVNNTSLGSFYNSEGVAISSRYPVNRNGMVRCTAVAKNGIDGKKYIVWYVNV